MAITRPDEYKHTNSNLSFTDSLEVRGGLKQLNDFATVPLGTIPVDKLKTGNLLYITAGINEGNLYKLINIADHTQTSNWELLGGVTELIEDTTPQLGGNLDVNGNKIISTSNGDIVIEPNGTGKTNIKALVVSDPSDLTKKFILDISAITTSTTRNLVIPDEDVDLANLKYITTLGSLEMPSSVGGYTAGTTASSLVGRTMTQMMNDLLFPTVDAEISVAASVSLIVSGTTGNVEVGTTLNNTLTATFNVGTILDGNKVTTHPLVGSASQYTFTGTGISSTAQVGNSLGINVNAVLGDNDWEVSTDHNAETEDYFNNKGVSGSNLDASRNVGTVVDNNASPNITGYYALFYGVGGTTPSNSTEARALTLTLDTSNSFTLNTGSSETKFKILLPPGRTITSVIDLDALNVNITSSYVLLGTMTVQDAGGNNRTYNKYEMNIGSPYSSSHRHSMTFTG